MSTPSTFEEAAADAAEQIRPWTHAKWLNWLRSDVNRLAEAIPTGDLGRITTARYFMSLAGNALNQLVELRDETSFDRPHWVSVLEDTVYLIVRKQAGYGHNNITRFGMLGLVVRVHDKVARLENLLERQGTDDVGESIDDTLQDIVGYGLIAVMLDNDTFSLPLRRDVKAADTGKSVFTNPRDVLDAEYAQDHQGEAHLTKVGAPPKPSSWRPIKSTPLPPADATGFWTAAYERERATIDREQHNLLSETLDMLVIDAKSRLCCTADLENSTEHEQWLGAVQ